MKKVVLSLAAVALLTVVSCKDANAEAQVEEVQVEEVTVEPAQEEVINVETTEEEVSVEVTTEEAAQ
ncbi:MAG TPA: hypothetical protein VLZ11_05910 [Flavobacterium sp.]|nr:hypothetical protein [Flavobacterium sp.]